MSSERLTKDRLRRAILQEFKMLGMGSPAPMQMKSLAHSHGHDYNPSGCDACGASPCGCDEYPEGEISVHTISSPASIGKGSVSREACCEAVICMVECCACPITKQALIQCCQALMSGDYDQ